MDSLLFFVKRRINASHFCIIAFNIEKSNVPEFFSTYKQMKVGEIEKTNNNGAKFKLRIHKFSAPNSAICTVAMIRTVMTSRLLCPRLLNVPVSKPATAIIIKDRL